MITTLLFKVFERMHDRKVPGMVAAVSNDSVSEKTVRNWIARRTTPDPELLEQFRSGSRGTLLKSLEGKNWPAQAREKFAEGLEACPGFVSSFAFGLQNGSGQYPAFLQLATQLDLLEQAIGVQRANDDVQGWVQTLLETTWLRDEHLTNPDTGASADEMRSQLRAATSWEELDLPARLLVLNMQFQFLATLDLEFCATFLQGCEATPVFAALLPCLDPRVDLVGKTSIPTTRDLYRYPTRRLLDATACMRVMRESPGHRWPQSMPAAEEMARWLDLAGRDKLASNLPKWRSGRTITAARFEELWDACFEFVLEVERPSAPMPMLYAALVFMELFIKGSREHRNLTFISPDPAFYLHWWDIQRQALAAGPQPLRFGTEKWMPDLT